MCTIHQLVTNYKRIVKKRKTHAKALKKCPFRIGVVQKVLIESPKKPNSAKRKVVKIKLAVTKKVIKCYIPGIGHKLAKHSVIKIRGGRCQDLIGVHYKAIRGCLDLAPVANRVSRPTKFGIKKIK